MSTRPRFFTKIQQQYIFIYTGAKKHLIYTEGLINQLNKILTSELIDNTKDIPILLY